MTHPPPEGNAHEASRRAWEANAVFWDDYMGTKGNDFVNTLIWPHTVRLLNIQQDDRVLDVACGNGLYALRLADLGARVVGFDFSAALIDRAKEHSAGREAQIAYHVIDATDLDAMLALGEGVFDAAVCNMALFDMSDIDPLAEAVGRLVRQGGRFVFSVMHPCFNGMQTTFVNETADDGTDIATRHYLKLSSYLTPFIANGLALRRQPVPQPYFHRPLEALLDPFFRAGFAINALEEAAFPPGHEPDKMGWSGNYSEFPPVLIVRLSNNRGNRR